MAVAPLVDVVSARAGTLTFTAEGFEGSVVVPTLVQKLECGHEADPIITGGCRVSNKQVPRRRRCKLCLAAQEGASDADTGRTETP